MPDYLCRVIEQSFKMPPDVIMKSLDICDNEGRFWITSNGDVISFCRPDALFKVFGDNGDGYIQVNINNRNYYIHRLMALSFNADEKKKKIYNNCEIHHLDRNKSNNKLENLCILTPEKHQAIHNLWKIIDKMEVIPWEQMKL